MPAKIKPHPDLVNDPIAWVKAAIRVAQRRGGCRRKYTDGVRVCAVGALREVATGDPKKPVKQEIYTPGFLDVSFDNDLHAPKNQNPAVWALRRLLKRLQESKR